MGEEDIIKLVRETFSGVTEPEDSLVTFNQPHPINYSNISEDCLLQPYRGI